MDNRVGTLARAGQQPTATGASATADASASASAAAEALPPLFVSDSGGGGAQPPGHERHHHNDQQQQVVPSWDHAAPPAAKRRRSGAPREGCSTCRLRKVKCSGRPEDNGPCANCLRLNYDCSFVDAEQGKVSRVAPSRDRTEAGTARKRAQKACQECHLHKTKCSGDLPRCKRCEANNLVCEYVASRRKFSHAPPALQSTPQSDGHEIEAGPSSAGVKDDSKSLTSPVGFAISPALTSQTARSSIGNLYGEDLLAQKDLVLKHFDAFFQLWAPMPCMGIMHEETTYAEIQERRLHPIVAAAVCAMTSRIIAPGQRQIPFADRCADQVDFYLFRTIDSILRNTAHENLIVLVCALCHFWHENQMSKVWMYMGLAARLITALQLNWDGAGESLIKQETNRRLVWACYILDRLLAGGFDEHLVLRDDDMHLKLPVSNEVLFEAVKASAAGGQDVRPGGPIGMSNSKKLCLDGYHLRLHRLRHHILGVTKRLTSPPISHPRRPRLEASQVIKLVNGLQNQLISFKSTLSEELTLTDANIDHFLNSADGPSFIMLHSLFWILHVDLYRFTIPGIREEANPELSKQLPWDFVHKSQRQAVGYAVSLARFWRKLQGIVAKRPPGNGTEKLLTVDQMFAIYVIQPTKILLAARQHHLYDDLEDSTAPLVRQEPVDDAALAALVQSNMQLIPPFARFFPRIMDLTQDLRQAVDNFTHNTRYDHVGTIGAPAVRPPENFRLPAPHYILENAFQGRKTDQEDRDREKQRKTWAADRWFRSKKRSTEESPIMMTPPMTRAPDEMAVIPLPATGAPEIPIWLAEARGCDPLPETPPQDTSSPDAHPWLTTQSGVGLGLSNAYLFENSWSMPPPPQTDYSMAYGLSGNPTALLYERARGSASAAIIPPMHTGGSGASENRRYYDRESGTQLPSPYSQQLNEFVG